MPDCSRAPQLALEGRYEHGDLGKPLRTVHRKAAHVCPCHARPMPESQAGRP
jgi:hypothetical protein